MAMRFGAANLEIGYIFFLLTCFYLVQTTFMAYDRLLEVKRNYKELFISFIPYIGILLFFVWGLISSNFTKSLSFILIVLHLLRILSLSLRVYYTRKLYSIRFPVKYLLVNLTTMSFVGLIIGIISQFIV